VSDLSLDVRVAMRDAFHKLLAKLSREEDVRHAMDTAPGYSARLWEQMSEIGITGLLVPARYGGIGAGPVELEMLMEEAGASLLCSPLLSSGVLSAVVLSSSSDEEIKARLLPDLASGKRIGALAFTGNRGLWTADDVEVAAAQTRDGWRLQGTSSYVLSAAQADFLLIFARRGSGCACFEVDPKDPQVVVEALPSWDATLRISKVICSGATGTPIAGADWRIAERALDFARIALVGEQAGGSRRIFDITIDHIKTRVQFGRAVGAFQAMKHMAADLLLEVESATSAARCAAQALTEHAPDAGALVSLATFTCKDVFVQVAASAIQMHGGIAFTWDHPAHLYLRRARADAQLFGTSASYRERYLAQLEQRI